VRRVTARRKSGFPDLRILKWPISGKPEIGCAPNPPYEVMMREVDNG
jgi:hypothetical protein